MSEENFYWDLKVLSILSACGDEDLPDHGREGSVIQVELKNKSIYVLQIPVICCFH
jgi:hypothetical protein